MSETRMRGFAHRAEVSDARALITARVAPLSPEPAVVTACAGRALAAPVIAPIDVPGYDRSAMDGYALRAEETFGASTATPMRFRLAGEAYPGTPFTGRVEAGEAVRIMTGAAVPEGADGVAQAESAREQADGVFIMEPIPPGRNIGRRGEDVKQGTEVLTAGRRLRPQDAALIASLGLSPVMVVGRPRVDILITGNELVPAGEQPPAGRIVDSNSVMLVALALRDGALPSRPRLVPDRAEDLSAAITSATGDVILISGGSSVGLEDHAPAVVSRLGELPIHGVAMRPSSPSGIGFLPPRAPGGRERPVFLLPGHPVSCLCAYDFFAGLALRRLGGLPDTWPYRSIRRPLARKIVSAVGRLDYVRVRLASGQVEPIGISGAAILSSTVRADGFVVVPPDLEGYAEGTDVEVHLYD